MKKLFIIFGILLQTASVSAQSGWVLQTIDTAMVFVNLSYKDSNICQLGGAIAELYGSRVYYSQNALQNWQSVTPGGYGAYQMQFINANTGFILVWGHNDLHLSRSVNAGVTWYETLFSSIVPGRYTKFYFINSSTGYLWKDSSVIKTTNDGANWINAYFFPVYNYSELCFVNNNTGFINGNNAFTNNATIGKTTNQGAGWVTFDITTTCRKIEFVNEQTGYAICAGPFVLKTTNAGDSWTSTSIPSAVDFISISFLNASTGYILMASAKILKTTNGGTNWTTQILPVGNLTVKEVEFATTSRGVITCSGGRILKTTTGGEVLGIHLNNNSIPSEYSLSQNYPNPFNPNTQIKFDVPKSSLVQLLIYDAAGREVEFLVNEELQAGSYSVDWNASSYPSGVYFYRITAGEFAQTKKMVLIK